MRYRKQKVSTILQIFKEVARIPVRPLPLHIHDLMGGVFERAVRHALKMSTECHYDCIDVRLVIALAIKPFLMLLFKFFASFMRKVTAIDHGFHYLYEETRAKNRPVNIKNRHFSLCRHAPYVALIEKNRKCNYMTLHYAAAK